MWEFRNLDVVANSLREEPDKHLAGLIGFRFVRFLNKVAQRHPCQIRSRAITNLAYFDGVGDRFVLLLPGDWYVAYRVSPGCSSPDGFVEFIHTGPLDQDLLPQP